ncbi:MAG: proline dehydrogenase family protein, partial [Actinomycetota bacterium]
MPNRLLLSAAELPFVRRLVVANSLTRSVVRRFVAGETLEEGIAAAAALVGQGTLAILDYLGELVATEEQADAAASLYLDGLRRIGEEGLDAHVAVKLTQLGLNLSEETTATRVQRLAAAAGDAASTVAIDMESHEHTDSTIAVYRRVRASHDNLVLCLQAYLRRTAADVEALLPLQPSLRICKGAYREPKELVFGPDETRRSYVS